MYLIQFLVFYFFWIILSGQFDAFHLISGALCSALVTYMSGDLMFGKSESKKIISEFFRLLLFTPWLIWQIILSNFHMAYLILNPKMPINPQLVRFNFDLQNNRAKTALANSITLTPGTVTIFISDLSIPDAVEYQYCQECGIVPSTQNNKTETTTRSIFFIHAISAKPCQDILDGEMIRKILGIFK